MAQADWSKTYLYNILPHPCAWYDSIVMLQQIRSYLLGETKGASLTSSQLLFRSTILAVIMALALLAITGTLYLGVQLLPKS